MANSKDVLQSIKKEQFFLLGKIIDNGNAVKNAHRGALAAVDALSKDYQPEYLADQKQRVNNQHTEKYKALHSDAKTQLEKLHNALNELHGMLDLSDPALKTALDMIKNVGQDLGIDNILRINEQFKGNQPALRILQSAYKAAGIVADGGLDSQIYDPANLVNYINECADSALLQDGSVFQFGVAIGKLAKLENINFPQGEPFPTLHESTVEMDLESMTNSARSAAGL